jgi:5'-nucleotidase
MGLTPDWVLSGINAGAKLGADVHISGTVAAVREAMLLGRRGVALSHFKKRHLDFDWPRAARWTGRVLEAIFARGCPPAAFWNVNFPHPAPDEPEPRIVFCPLDSQALPVRYRREGELFHYDGDYHGRPRDAGGDVEVCMGGGISVSLVRFGEVVGS